MSIKRKVSNFFWYLGKPKYWQHRINVEKRKYLTNYDKTDDKIKGFQWCENNVSNYEDALIKVGLEKTLHNLDQKIIDSGNRIQAKCPIKLGGSSHINLIYNCIIQIKAKLVIETGVAYGWSSLAILKGLSETTNGKLVSVDMPYVNKKSENYVGIVVPNFLRKNWVILDQPDIPGIKNAIKISGEKVDLCHYDSDKTWWGRDYAYPLLWDSLKPGGLFISDDINDNLYFSEFVKNKSASFSVIKHGERFIGMIRKQE